MRISLASRNENKLRELARVLDGWQLELLGADGYPPEEGATYYENALAKARHTAAADVLLEAEGLEAERLTGVSFALRRGEILGLGGLQGQGQSQLLRALYGIVPIRRGKVRLGGKPLVLKSPLAAMRRSMAYISGDRARHGVMAARSIFENLVLSLLMRERRFAVPRRRLEGEVGPILKRLKLKFANFAAPVSQLSGVITAFPATIAAVAMPVRIASGKFQGAMMTPTPRGHQCWELDSPETICVRFARPRSRMTAA